MTQFTTQCGHFYTIGLRPLACGVGVIWEEEGGREKREKKRGTDLTTEGGRGGGLAPTFLAPLPDYACYAGYQTSHTLFLPSLKFLACPLTNNTKNEMLNCISMFVSNI